MAKRRPIVGGDRLVNATQDQIATIGAVADEWNSRGNPDPRYARNHAETRHHLFMKRNASLVRIGAVVVGQRQVEDYQVLRTESRIDREQA
jgi:hypothetical protein